MARGPPGALRYRSIPRVNGECIIARWLTQGLERRRRGKPADPASADRFTRDDPLAAMSL